MTKKQIKWTIIGVVALLAVITLNESWFVLREDEVAIRQRFGRVDGIYVKDGGDTLRSQLAEDGVDNEVDVTVGAGLHFKLPFVDRVSKYSARLQTYAPPPREVIASDKKKLYFDNVAQWRIDNPYRFYMAVRDTVTAGDRIDGILYSIMNEKVGKITSTDLITNKESNIKMLQELATEANERTYELGVTIVDIRIKRTDLPQENYNSIYERMRTERESIAAQYRSEGKEEAMKIRSQTDKEAVTITSEAFAKAEKLKGEGDSAAAAIYAAAYGKTPEFFEFYNTLETYRTTIGNQSTLVIPSNSHFAKLLLGTDE